jgi:acetylornithine deacetylase/succinyl-diaminopimelate desuccinylase-like protein
MLRAFVRARDATAKVRERGAMSPCLDTPETNPFVRKLVDCGAALTGAPWFCDAAFLSDIAQVPAIALGPGSIAQAHTKDEWIEIAELEKGATFWMKWLKAL